MQAATGDVDTTRPEEVKEARACASASAPAEEQLQQAVFTGKVAPPNVVTQPDPSPVMASAKCPEADRTSDEQRGVPVPTGPGLEQEPRCLPDATGGGDCPQGTPTAPAAVDMAGASLGGESVPVHRLATDQSYPERDKSAHPSLNEQASISLRTYAKRNKPAKNKKKFMTGPACLGAAADVPPAKTEPTSSDALNEKTEPSEPSPKSSTIEEQMIGVLVEYDIFDEIDADRLKEFDEMFSKVKLKSNYEAHKKKMKGLNKSKFSTACVVATDTETGDTKIT